MNLKYKFLYNSSNELTTIKEAVKGEYYYMYDDKTSKYIVRDGDINQKHFSLKVDGDFSFKSITNESIEHYNAKMEIVYNKCYYDTIFEKTIYFDEVIPEKKQGSKRPDLSCYINKKLVLCIEIFKTNNKSIEDIEILKSIKKPIIEININNDNRCKHLVLPEVLEINKQKYNELYRIYSELKKEESKIKEQNRERLSADDRNRQNNIKFNQGRIDFIKSRIELYSAEINGLQPEVDHNQTDINSVKERIEYNKREIPRIKERIKRNKTDLRESERKFKEVAEKSEVKWFRNHWMKSVVQNKIEEIKYWTT